MRVRYLQSKSSQRLRETSTVSKWRCRRDSFQRSRIRSANKCSNSYERHLVGISVCLVRSGCQVWMTSPFLPCSLRLSERGQAITLLWSSVKLSTQPSISPCCFDENENKKPALSITKRRCSRGTTFVCLRGRRPFRLDGWLITGVPDCLALGHPLKIMFVITWLAYRTNRKLSMKFYFLLFFSLRFNMLYR